MYIYVLYVHMNMNMCVCRMERKNGWFNEIDFEQNRAKHKWMCKHNIEETPQGYGLVI